MIYVTMVDPEGVLLGEIADKRMRRDDIALTYAFALRTPDEVDWSKVNHAIVDQRSFASLRYIKDKAWKLHRTATLRTTEEAS